MVMRDDSDGAASSRRASGIGDRLRLLPQLGQLKAPGVGVVSGGGEGEVSGRGVVVS